MRQIIFDTETTGFKPPKDRVVEIGALEMVNGAITGAKFHVYVNPEREMPDGAFKVHGLSTAFLSDKPVFTDPAIGQAFLDFVGDAELVAHNAEFDMGFMQAELAEAKLPTLQNSVVDTLAIARKKFPGSPASLDALCARFNIDTAARERHGHGALLDARLLAEVYIELTGGAQAGLDFSNRQAGADGKPLIEQTLQRPKPLDDVARPEELENHQQFIAELANPVWSKYRVV